MTFKRILIALDGSKFSENAAQYGYWLTTKLSARLTGQNVVDPRLMDALLAPEFAREVETATSIESAEKVHKAIKDVGAIILDLFRQEAKKHNIEAVTHLDEGHVVGEIVSRSKDFDLIVIGHHGRGHTRIATDLITGSIAERVSVQAKKPVLIAIDEPDRIERIVVAFDGSEPSRGALLLAQYFCKEMDLKLQVVLVVPSWDKKLQEELTIEQARSLLSEPCSDDTFIKLEGFTAAEALIQHTVNGRDLLLVGAYGFRDPQENVLGSTTTSLVRHTRCSLLVYR